MKHVMIDLETLGVGPLASILSIGWCRFTPDTIAEPRKLQVDVESCLKAGMRIKDSTFRWWMKQSDAARKELGSADPIALYDALCAFSATFTEDEIVWGNGSNFDISILEVAYDLCELETPWKFWNVGCYRTLKRHAPNTPRVIPTVPHCAAADAEAQAKHLQMIWKDLDLQA